MSFFFNYLFLIPDYLRARSDDVMSEGPVSAERMLCKYVVPSPAAQAMLLQGNCFSRLPRGRGDGNSGLVTRDGYLRTAIL